MLFWYPGEAGSTAEAQGTLDAFFDYINSRIAPDKISGKYFNTVNEGLNFIRQAKPRFGIISFAAYTINAGRLGGTTRLLSTLPLLEGRPTENYTIVGRGPTPASWNIILYTKQPLTKDFVGKYILPAGTASPNITLVPNILPVLKDVADGIKGGGVILQPMESHTLKNIDQPWTKGLSVWLTSNPVPSAPLMVFGNKDPLSQKLEEILLKMPDDPKGAEILQALRLNGFSIHP